MTLRTLSLYSLSFPLLFACSSSDEPSAPVDDPSEVATGGSTSNIPPEPGLPSDGSGGTTSVPPAERPPVLVLAHPSGTVDIWHNADTVEDGSGPTLTLNVPGSIDGLFSSANRLGVVSTDGIFLYDSPEALEGTSAPSVVIPPTAFSGNLTFDRNTSHFVDAQGDLWVTYDEEAGRVALFPDVDALTADSVPKAEFVLGARDPIGTASYSESADTLFAVPSFGGVFAFISPKAQTGEVTAFETVDSAFGNGVGATIAGDSLVVSQANPAQTRIWRGLTNPGAPAVTLRSGNSRPVASADAFAILDLSHSAIHYYPGLSTMTAGAAPVVFDTGPISEDFDLSNDGLSVLVPGNQLAWLTYDGSTLGLTKTLAPSERSSLSAAALLIE